MINKLLVAIDGSSHSMKAVDYASAIAVGCKARVIILNVIKVLTVPKISVELRKYAGGVARLVENWRTGVSS
jgi:nucleotide-binding universal stress UspA family protein